MDSSHLKRNIAKVGGVHTIEELSVLSVANYSIVAQNKTTFSENHCVAMDKSLRLDKWLWAARFFKTRSLASDAVNGGKVHLNGARVKPGRVVHVDDKLRILRGGFVYEIVVQAINSKRRPASEAQLLYDENEASVQEREKRIEAQRLIAGNRHETERRPNKKQRRHIIRFKREQ